MSLPFLSHLLRNLLVGECYIENSTDLAYTIELESPEALRRFFELMLAVLRVINAVVLAHGQQHDATIQLARQFLADNRQTIVAVFKRHANIGGFRVEEGINLGELVDNFTLLLSSTDFMKVSSKCNCVELMTDVRIQYEDEGSSQKRRLTAFS